MIDEAVLDIAKRIHGEVCDCDDKNCTITGEIYDWLVMGDVTPDNAPPLQELVDEWNEDMGA